MSQCPAPTSSGRPCQVGGEASRAGYCHMHDPDGQFAKQHPKYQRKLRAKAAALAKAAPGQTKGEWLVSNVLGPW